MQTTRIDIELGHSILPSGVASSAIYDWTNIELTDDSLYSAIGELESLIESWIQRRAINKQDFA